MAKPDPTKITWDDLNDKNVDERLREQATISSTAAHYERADVIAPKIAGPGPIRRLLLNAIFYLCVLGGLGAAVGWIAGESLNLRKDRRAEAARWLDELDRTDLAFKAGRYSESDAASVRAKLMERGKNNPHFVAKATASMAPATREAYVRAADRADRAVAFRADVFALGLVGVGAGAALAAADHLIGRQWKSAFVDAALGAAVGQAGGIAVAAALRAFDLGSIGDADAPATNLIRVLGWTVLGAFVGASPGIVIRSGRRALLGVAGGVVGGLIGGLVFAPMETATGDARFARAFGAIVVGAASGLAIGSLERVARQGWLRVTEGLIAGKQFILYRNPTLVGSAPTSHIYLFRDKDVGRRHAAIFASDGHFEIENLPLGGPTLVNDAPVDRVRLRGGDRIRIGRSLFVFEERRQ